MCKSLYILILVLSSFTISKVQGQQCEPQWAQGLFNSGTISGPARVMNVFDDGTGPALYIGGNSGGINRWSGIDWEQMPNIPNMNEPVYALTVFDDGSGSALYAGGRFTEIDDDQILNHIGKWDGKNWFPLENGLNDYVLALVVFDDGSGEKLYAGGDFFEHLFEGIHFIAKWTGTTWEPLNTGLNDLFNDLNGAVHAFAKFDDGTGEALFVGGEFTLASGVTVNRIAKWDGKQWSALGVGLDDTVLSLKVFDDGTGEALYVGGEFTTAGGLDAQYITKWDGKQWFDLQGGMDDTVLTLNVVDSGDGIVLWVGGEFHTAGEILADLVAQWDGINWSMPGNGFGGIHANIPAVYSIETFNGSTYAAGDMSIIQENPTFGVDIARWNENEWEPLGQAVGSGTINAALSSDFDDAVGTALYTAGSFNNSGRVATNHVARWDGTSWWPLGLGLQSTAEAMTIYDDGSGDALVVAGDFNETEDGVVVNNIAKWDGKQWHAFGDGILGASLEAVAVYDAGNGSELYVAGDFFNKNVPGDWIARWDGEQWLALGDGIDYIARTMIVHDDGDGPALFVGGTFDIAGGIVVNGIAKWNGTTWSQVGEGVDGSVFALEIFDDGSGPALYAGGYFTTADGLPASNIAKWDGQNWSNLGGGTGGTDGSILGMHVFNDGSGDALYVGGSFEFVEGMPANRIARWDGSTWSVMSNGMNAKVSDFAVYDDGAGEALYAVGPFNTAGTYSSGHIAKWLHCSPSIPGDLDGDGIVSTTDLLLLFSQWGPCADCKDCLADLNGDCTVNTSDMLLLFSNWG